MTKEEREKITQLLDIHMKHYERMVNSGEHENAEKQRIYYDGIFTACDHLLIPDYILTGRYTTNHKIEERD